MFYFPFLFHFQLSELFDTFQQFSEDPTFGVKLQAWVLTSQFLKLSC